MKYIKYDSFSKPTYIEKDRIADFLYTHLEEYGDSKADIIKCLDFALKERSSHGGFIIISTSDDGEWAGICVINKTGMDGYIPENILVYIAVKSSFRGKGVGKALMQHVISQTNGDIALHVEKDNPAFHLYKKLGFEDKYLEMRLTNSKKKQALSSESIGEQV